MDLIQELREKKKQRLRDCLPHEAFWFCNGVVSRNLYELKSKIRSLSEHNFKYHVNKDKNKNDFADWIRDVIGDKELALDLKEIDDKEKYANIILRKIKYLEEA